MKNFDLSNKNALITGSCGLLGVKHAKALLEIGSNVVLTDIDQETLIKTKITNDAQKRRDIADRYSP